MLEEIILGSDSGGAVIVSRLSEDPHPRILLVESAPDYVSPDETPESILSGLKLPRATTIRVLPQIW
jgi:hypothetical protein